jgi:hypothetical protein
VTRTTREVTTCSKICKANFDYSPHIKTKRTRPGSQRDAKPASVLLDAHDDAFLVDVGEGILSVGLMRILIPSRGSGIPENQAVAAWIWGWSQVPTVTPRALFPWTNQVLR